VPFLGERGCRVEEGVLKRQLAWADGQDYLADIGAGALTPFLNAYDSLADSNTSTIVAGREGVGVFLGEAAVAVLGARTVQAAGGVIGVSRAATQAGMTAGGGIDIGVQLALNGLDVSKVDLSSSYFSALSGAFGMAWGGKVAGLGLNLRQTVFLNGLGSAGIGGGVTYLQNLLSGSCNDVVLSAAFSGLLGAGGSGIADGWLARNTFLRGRAYDSHIEDITTKWFRNRVLSGQTPRNSVDWSLAYRGFRRNSMYLAGANRSMPPMFNNTAIAIANGLGISLSNSGAFANFIYGVLGSLTDESSAP
jgi:hypothetical protein